MVLRRFQHADRYVRGEQSASHRIEVMDGRDRHDQEGGASPVGERRES